MPDGHRRHYGRMHRGMWRSYTYVPPTEVRVTVQPLQVDATTVAAVVGVGAVILIAAYFLAKK